MAKFHKQMMTNVDKNVGKTETYPLLVGLQTDAGTMEISVKFLKKLKI